MANPKWRRQSEKATSAKILKEIKKGSEIGWDSLINACIKYIELSEKFLSRNHFACTLVSILHVGQLLRVLIVSKNGD